MARVLGVICARGWSAGLPGKNAAQVAGHSMLWHSIQQARGSLTLSRFVVSTDSEKLRDEANGILQDCAPFIRPAELATSDAKIERALQHALGYCETQEGEGYDYICMLLNSHPLRVSADIDGSVVTLDNAPEEYSFDSVLSGYWIEHPYELRPMSKSPIGDIAFGKLRLYNQYYRRQQDMSKVFLGNGAVVVMTWECLMKKDSIWGDKSLVYPMPMYRSVDIDTEDQLRFAELMLGGGPNGMSIM